jgi:hypothetical protein
VWWEMKHSACSSVEHGGGGKAAALQFNSNPLPPYALPQARSGF